MTDQGAAARRPAIFRKDRAMTPNNEPRLQTGYDYLAASLTSGPDAHQYRALLRAYLDHYDMGTTGDDTTADRIAIAANNAAPTSARGIGGTGPGCFASA